MTIGQIDTAALITGYYYLAIFSTLIFTIKLILFTITGGDGTEVSADFTSEIDTDISFNFLSVQSVLAFFMGFGWMGYAGLNQFKFSNWTAFGVAMAVGLAFLFGTAFLMFGIRKLEKNVKKDNTTALNKTGKAYTAFAPKGQGQIEIEVNEQLSVVDAVNNTDEDIKSFDRIKVVNVDNDILYIEKI